MDTRTEPYSFAIIIVQSAIPHPNLSPILRTKQDADSKWGITFVSLVKHIFGPPAGSLWNIRFLSYASFTLAGTVFMFRAGDNGHI